jgi:hypothetical protein
MLSFEKAKKLMLSYEKAKSQSKQALKVEIRD